ncbi:MAG: DNA translocase FtsK 4TM domain-containing protein [Clostridia bacterium]|nr:DNA translocase FtsK 4TM domain-containing protein [Clostridia bacterium]
MAAKRRSRKKTPEQKARMEKKALAKRQMTALLLFVCAVFCLCLLLIPGQRVWSAMRNFVFGVFGWSCWLVPVFLCYFSVMLALEKSELKTSSALLQCVSLMVLGASTVQIFAENIVDGAGYFGTIGQSYADKRGGVLGTLLGYPLEYFLGDIGAKIVIILLLFITLMLLCNITMSAFYKAVYKPIQKTKETVQQAIEDSRERRRNANIDVNIDDDKYSDGDTDVLVPPVIQGNEEESSESNEKFNAFTQAAKSLQEDASHPTPRVEDLLAKQQISSDPEKLQNDPEKKTADQKDDTAAAAAEEKKAEPVKAYRYPPISLLSSLQKNDEAQSNAEIQHNADLLVKTLKDFGIVTRIIDISRGPSVTRYELEPSAGVKVSRITGLADDLALRLATTGVRIEAPIPNKAAVGIEVPNKTGQTVSLREILDSREFAASKGRLTVALGRDIAGKVVLADLGKMPHLLIAGTTGSGKSVCTNAMIQSLLYRNSPEDVRLVLIDPKQVEFGIYNGIPHLLTKVVTDPRKAAGALGWAVTEMLNRYKTFAENNVRDITAYNDLAAASDTLQKMPLIVIVIDELADLMMAAANEVEDAIIRLAQMARAAGMHLVIATQRPSVDVITGLIKANIPSRLALTVASGVDSRTILDCVGAEKLLGHGDMLFMPIGMSKPIRVQGCFVSEKEVKAVVDFLKSNADEEAKYDEAIAHDIELRAAASGKNSSKSIAGDSDADGEESEYDEMLPQAIEVVVEAGMASTSLLQRKLRLGYARAGRIIDELENRGIVGPHEGSKPRQVLITRQQWLEMNLRAEEPQEKG